MSKLTVCPHLLFGYGIQNPDDIEELIIHPLKSILSKAQSLNVPVVFSSHILDLMLEAFPWDRISDPEWSGYLRDWNQVIMQHIAKRCELVEHGLHTQHQKIICTQLTQEINDIFVSFLDTFIVNRFAVNLYSEGIVSSTACGAGITYKKIHSVKCEDDIYPVIYPWLRTHDKRLPYMGQFPFEPVRNWMTLATPPRGVNNGYIDIRGNEWVWDTLHKDHWDVQMRNTYENVTPDGRIL